MSVPFFFEGPVPGKEFSISVDSTTPLEPIPGQKGRLGRRVILVDSKGETYDGSPSDEQGVFILETQAEVNADRVTVDDGDVKEVIR